MANANRRSVAVLGVPFDNVTMDEAVAFIEEKIQENCFHQVATANVDFLMHAIRDRELQEILCSCDLVVPDGMPILWAARMMGVRLKERVSGVDLIPRLAQLSAERGYRIFLLGASEQSSRRAAEFLKERHPGVCIAGRCSPPLASLEDMDHETILAKIRRARPEILLVAMGNPKQEKWLAMHRDRLEVPLCMGVGGSLDFIGGTVSRAPEWMQNSGLEWLHRAYQEPGRLALRYLNDAAGLARHLPPQVATSAAQPRKPASSALQAYDIDSALVVVMNGNVSSALLTEFDHFMQRVGEEQRHVILDMSQVGYVGPDTLGSLIHRMQRAKRQRQQFWLADLPVHVRRLLRAARLDHCFDTTPTVADALYRLEKAERLLPAELTAARCLSRDARRGLHVQVEFLEDLCKRMASVKETAQFDFAGFNTRTSTSR